MAKRDKHSERFQRKSAEEASLRYKRETSFGVVATPEDNEHSVRFNLGKETVTGRFTSYTMNNDLYSHLREQMEKSELDFLKVTAEFRQRFESKEELYRYLYGGEPYFEDEVQEENYYAARNMEELISRHGYERTLKCLISILEEMGDLDSIFQILQAEMQNRPPRLRREDIYSRDERFTCHQGDHIWREITSMDDIVRKYVCDRCGRRTNHAA